MSLIQDFLASTDDSESPKQYFFWSFLSAIASVVNNKVYLDKFYYKLYPNLYVLLVGKSGLRKGVPVAIAKELVQMVGNTRVMSGRMSIQAMLKELGTARGREKLPPLTDAVGYLVSSEFGSFIVEDDQALTILTDLYDGHYNKNWKNLLKTAGIDTLKNVNLNLLGAINPIHFKTSIPPNAIGGGFIARTFIILESKKHRVNSLTTQPDKKLDLEYYVEQLSEISNFEGEIVWSPDGKYIYNEWYKIFSEDEVNDDTGTAERLHDHVLKVAMLIALSQKRMVLTDVDITVAIDSCADFSANAVKLTVGGNKKDSADPLSPVVQKICEILYETPDHIIARRFLIQKLYSKMGATSPQVDACINNLSEMGFVISERRAHDIFYIMNSDGKASYESLFMNKKKII